jgi:hypothetical protein
VATAFVAAAAAALLLLPHACRMKLPEAVGSIQFYKSDHFLCLTGNTVSNICLGSGMATQPRTALNRSCVWQFNAFT